MWSRTYQKSIKQPGTQKYPLLANIKYEWLSWFIRNWTGKEICHWVTYLFYSFKNKYTAVTVVGSSKKIKPDNLHHCRHLIFIQLQLFTFPMSLWCSIRQAKFRTIIMHRKNIVWNNLKYYSNNFTLKKVTLKCLV